MARKKATAEAAAPTDAQVEQTMIAAHHQEVDKQLAQLPMAEPVAPPAEAAQQPSTTVDPTSFDPVALEALPANEEAPAPAARGARPQRAKPQPHRHVLTESVGDSKVHMVDEVVKDRDGLHRKLGVEIEYADDKERPSDAVRELLKKPLDEEGKYGGLRFSPDQQGKPWLKEAPLDGRAGVAAELQTEQRWAEVVEQMRAEKEGGPQVG